MTGLLLTAANTTTTTTGLQNASASLTNGFGSSFGLFGPILVVLVAAIVLVFVGSHVNRIEWLHDKLKAFSRSLYYTAVGVGFSLFVALFATPVYYLSQADGQTQARVGYALAGLVGAYVVFTGLGWVVEKTLMTNVRAYMEQLEAKE